MKCTHATLLYLLMQMWLLPWSALRCCCMETYILWCRCPKLSDEWSTTDLQWDEPDQNACNAWVLISGEEWHWERNGIGRGHRECRRVLGHGTLYITLQYHKLWTVHMCAQSVDQESRLICIAKSQGIQSWVSAKQKWATAGHNRDGSDLTNISATLNLWHGEYVQLRYHSGIAVW